MTSPKRPAIDWATIERVADKGELSRLESLSDKELDEELRRMGIEPEAADRIIAEALSKAGHAKVTWSAPPPHGGKPR